jgi:hypothetical protein
MPDVLDDTVGLQFRIWGYAITGDACEFSAVVAEDNLAAVLESKRAWDRTAAERATWMISHGDEPVRPVKEFAALSWVAEHLINGKIEGPCCPQYAYPTEWPGL